MATKKAAAKKSVTVKPMKDTMAKNIGSHMGPGVKKQAVKLSGGKAKK